MNRPGSNGRTLVAFWCSILALLAIVLGSTASAAGHTDIVIVCVIVFGVAVLVAWSALESNRRG